MSSDYDLLKSIRQTRVLNSFLEEMRQDRFNCLVFKKFLEYLGPLSNSADLKAAAKQIQEDFNVSQFLQKLDEYCTQHATQKDIDRISTLCDVIVSSTVR